MGYGVTSADAAGRRRARAGGGQSRRSTSPRSGPRSSPGAAHHALGNVDWRTVGILAAPGFVGAFAGATFLVQLDGEVARVVVAALLLALGALRHLAVPRAGAAALRRPALEARFLAPVGLVAGALDAVGGGGWGPVGTASMLSSGRLEPRKVIGVGRHRGVRGLGRRLARLPRRPRQPGHRVGRRGRAARRRRRGRADRRDLVRFLPARILGVAAGGLIVLTNVRTLGGAARRRAAHDRAARLARLTLWVLWISWAVKLDRAERAGGYGAPGRPRRLK